MKTAYQSFKLHALVACAALFASLILSFGVPIALNVDATDAPRKILHARMIVPVTPGRLTLVYPKWIPGEHAPTGNITDLVGLKINAGGKSLIWQRDAEDMYAFQIEVPAGTTTVEVAFDFLLSVGEGNSDCASTEQLLVLNWNQVLLYPRNAKSGELQYTVNLRLPDGWNYGTALSAAGQSSGTVQFASVTLETLVDSPLVAGVYFRTFDLTPGAGVSHKIHVVADSAAAMEMKPEDEVHFSHLVTEANALFGARHYDNYHFLLTLSEHVAYFGLEHHQSSDNRVGERFLLDEDTFKLAGTLLPHEMVHSWNGKYRRPAGLATPDFQQPMHGELLWVYEGLTTYLGNVLGTRCGLWTNDTFMEDLAQIAAALDNRAGRTWRPLADTTVAAQLLYASRREGLSWRRGTDFYPEGLLIWLEADVLIRQQTKGRLSLDAFCKNFFGGENTPPKVVPYTLDNIVTALNEVAPYNWREFFQSRVYDVNPHAPLGGVEGSGWRLAFTNSVPGLLKAREGARKFTDMSYSIGLVLKEDGTVQDVIPGLPSDKAGLGTGMKLVAVNGRRWTPALLRGAVKSAATNSSPLELLLENADYFKTCKVNYHDGEKYPCLERNAAKPDLLTEILKPVTPPPAVRVKKD